MGGSDPQNEGGATAHFAPPPPCLPFWFYYFIHSENQVALTVFLSFSILLQIRNSSTRFCLFIELVPFSNKGKIQKRLKIQIQKVEEEKTEQRWISEEYQIVSSVKMSK